MTNHAARVLGLVSNCWKAQLDQVQSLEALIEQAVRHGFRAVELRQGSLGDYESLAAESLSSPSARDKLARLSHRFPGVTFNLAVSVPCFGGDFRDDDPRFLAALQAARALAPDGRPHLRLVDTETRAPQMDDRSIDHTANVITGMTLKLIDAGGRLSIEHAYQSWSVFWSAFQQARERLGVDAPRLRSCFDPCNLLLTEPPEAVPAIVERVIPEDVSMIHLKQRRDGRIQPDVLDGDLDWPQLLESLQRRGHRGPWLFEVAPHEEIWDNLQRSIEFLFA